MSTPGRPLPAAGASLASLLRRGQMRVALVALLAVGLVLTLGSMLSLRLAQQHNLDLVGRSIAYSTEAAVVFRDAKAAREVLAAVVEQEQIADARIVLASGVELARYQRPRLGLLGEATARWLFPVQARAPIHYEGGTAATVQLRGDGSMLLAALAWALAGVLLGMLLGMLLTAAAVALLSRRMERLVIAPLRELAAHTRTIREQRAYGRRAPPALVQEIDALSADFNALLAEVQAREAELMERHEALSSDHAALSYQTRHDALTGVASRGYFEQRLEQAVERAGASGDGMGLLFIDADRFKQINDQYGHEAGDRVLTALAQRLRGAVREQDLVGRLGGDEFVVLIEPLRNAAAAQRVARQITEAAALPLDIGGGVQLIPGVSVGVAVFPEQGDSAEALLRAADASMYRSKQHARRGRPPEAERRAPPDAAPDVPDALARKAPP